MGEKICWIINNLAIHYPTVLKFGRLVHYGPRDESRERLAGRAGQAASSGNAALIVAFLRLYITKCRLIINAGSLMYACYAVISG